MNVVPGDPLLRGSIRVWDLAKRAIVRTIVIPSAIGTMDVKLIPHDPLGRACSDHDETGSARRRLQLRDVARR